MKYTTEQILDLVQQARERLSPEQTRELVVANTEHLDSNSRELIIANTEHLDSNSREVYKDLKIKREKYSSRLSEDTEATLTSSLLPETPLKPQEAFVNEITPATTSSRVKGISAQHVKTKTGIKLNVAIQTEQDAEDGMYVELTAELKRHSRLRELKHYEPDDAYFEELYINTINELKALTPEKGRSVCMGRLHVRGARGHWFANMFVVGQLNDQDQLHTVILHINGEEFEIALDGALSPRQQQLYYNTGIYGSLTTGRPAPRLETAVRKTFK
jgi:hypothetical protein